MNKAESVFYHVDRGNRLQPGQILTLEPPLFQSKHSQGIQSMLRKLFPSGVSLHGQQYILTNDLLFERWVAPMSISGPGSIIQTDKPHPEVFPDYSTIDDLVLELVRRSDHPDRPSRFETFFAWEDEETSRRFISDHKVNGGRIFTVRGVSRFRADMSWTKLGHSAAEAWYNARQYWAGAHRDGRLLEHLLTFPVEVLAEVA